MSKKPVVWTGDNDQLIPDVGLVMNGDEVEFPETVADEIETTSRARALDAQEKASSKRWARYAAAKEIAEPSENPRRPENPGRPERNE